MQYTSEIVLDESLPPARLEEEIQRLEILFATSLPYGDESVIEDYFRELREKYLLKGLNTSANRPVQPLLEQQPRDQQQQTGPRDAPAPRKPATGRKSKASKAEVPFTIQRVPQFSELGDPFRELRDV